MYIKSNNGESATSSTQTEELSCGINLDFSLITFKELNKIVRDFEHLALVPNYDSNYEDSNHVSISR